MLDERRATVGRMPIIWPITVVLLTTNGRIIINRHLMMASTFYGRTFTKF